MVEGLDITSDFNQMLEESIKRMKAGQEVEILQDLIRGTIPVKVLNIRVSLWNEDLEDYQDITFNQRDSDILFNKGIEGLLESRLKTVNKEGED